jgi:ABC-type Zn uptake system ZnuABC Zn-binding protein ZnuA
MRVLLIGFLAVVAGCGSSADGSSSDGPRVVATTTQLADMARNVAPDADVTAILNANTDPHAYEVRPADVKALAKADVVLRSGGETDEWLDDALESAGVGDDKIVDAGAAAGLEGDDPHWWQDPRKAEKAATAIGRGIAGADPGPYVEKLHALDRGVQACIDAVPADERLLVTSHDALGYFARRYGIRVVGTVIPSLSTSGQPSAGEVDALVNTIRETGVKTIFAESSVNPKVEDAIAREAGVTVGKELWADSLGPEGSDGATYIGSIEANTRALVEGFTGKPADCAFGDA